MYWVPLLAGVLNAAFILDLVATLATGESLGSLIGGASGNSVASVIVGAIPTDPLIFWAAAGFILLFVCAMECLVIYVALYSGAGRCECEKEVMN